MRLFSFALVSAVAGLLAACSSAAAQGGPSFGDGLLAHCGKAFEGRVVSTDPVDDAWRRARLVVHLRDCDETGFRLPLALDDDRSRTWVLTRTGPEGGWELRHVHLHEDGEPDILTLYGGYSGSAPAALRQEFPADTFSRELFVSQGIPESAQNVWAVEIAGDAGTLAYELRRPGRFFRVEFDLSGSVVPPPPHWGAAGTDRP